MDAPDPGSRGDREPELPGQLQAIASADPALALTARPGRLVTDLLHRSARKRRATGSTTYYPVLRWSPNRASATSRAATTTPRFMYHLAQFSGDAVIDMRSAAV
jgi:hypothetical protein